MQRRLLWLLAIVSALLLGCSPAPAPPAAPSSGHPFTIASFNVYHPASDDPSTVETIGKTGADVLFLQEVSPEWQSVLVQRYRTAYPYMLFAAAGGAGGLGVLSRFPLRDAGFLPPVMKHPAWLVAVQTPAGEIHVLNVHLRASRRRGQNLIAGIFGMASDHATEIRAFLEACSVAPTLVLGDFNEGPDGSAVEWLEGRGYINALERYRPGQPTWRWLPRAGLFRSTLDHILYRGSLPALDAWVLRSGYSDHWPLVARF